ncbi:mRNA-binding ribosome synthesis protein nop7 [Malassezia sp. CBS 17886]|nr:mRNA-binding ribosome synthesis protein nop7 [Malassezia sp. CBS 17886]
MAKIKRRGESGAAKNYITRNQALKKLQVTLAEFRRLCILKGIFPRQPRHVKRANKGSTAPTTFYYAKDIAYLQHEPVLQAFRDHKAFAKKVNRAIARREWHLAKNLDENRPAYRLDHIIKERYPTFVDSLRDLDDALSTLSLFANIPATQSLAPEITAHCARLCNEWQLYVMRAKCLRRVFLSIKGIYFQAVVHGQEITWLVPYMFTQNIPTDVDFRVMMTFLELYQTLLGFVLYKLYTDDGLVYPPRLDEDKDAQSAGVGSLQLMAADADVLGRSDLRPLDAAAQAAAENTIVRTDGKKVSARDVKRQIARVVTEAADGADDESLPEPDAGEAPVEAGDDFVPRASKHADDVDVLTTLGDLEQSQGDGTPNLFSPYVFYISRECPRAVMEFVLRAFGALPTNIGWDAAAGAGSEISERDERITHHIIDRPVPQNKPLRHPGRRVYVQPQWVIDCINARKLLPTDPYRPGASLPPHLSPFVDDAEVARLGGYVPAEANVAGEGDGKEEVEEGTDGETEEEEGDAEAEENLGAAEEATDTRPARRALLAEPEGAGRLEAAELEAEAAGGEDALLALRTQHAAARSAAKKRRGPTADALSEEAEARDMAQMLLSNKQRKLYNRMGHTAGRRADDKRKLEAKKKSLRRAPK